MRFTDEDLVAYADSELPAARAVEIAEAARGDAAIARRIEAYRESRRVLREAFSKQLGEPVPQKLLDVLAEPGAGSKVVRLRPRSTRLTLWLPLAAAASVALAVGLAFSGLLSPGARPIPLVVADAGLLTAALETQDSGVPMQRNGQEVLPLATLRTDQGRWCREFEARSNEGATLHKSRGIACRDDAGQWQLRVLAGRPDAPAPEAAGNYATASGGGIRLADTLNGAKQLTPEEERAAIHGGWITTNHQ